jgi:alpha-L-fucosidase
VDPTFGIDPVIETEILAQFATAKGAKVKKNRWMEKFGEWKCVYPVTDWKADAKAIFEVNVFAAGDYNVSLTYAGEGRIVWGVDVEGGEHIQNQQNSSHNYQEFPIGWINFPKPGKYNVSVSCLEGKQIKKSKLKSIHFTPIGE